MISIFCIKKDIRMLVLEIAREKIKKKNNRMSKRGGGGQTDRQTEKEKENPEKKT